MRIAFLVLLLATPAMANLRAPYAVDGKFGAHIDALHVHPDLVLTSEEFIASLPVLTVGEQPPEYAQILVAYDIENTSSTPITLPIRFLALGAYNVQILVNEANVDHQPIVDAKERDAAIDRIARARCAKAAPCEDVARFREPIARQLERDRERHRGQTFDSIAFEATLAPGRNKIQVAYAQQLLIHEGAYGYFMRGTFGTRGARYGFDYLLFPAETWKRSDDFRFSVRVVVSDVVDRSWWRTEHLAPAKIESTLSFERQTRLQYPATELFGFYRDFPTDVFSVTVHVPQ